MLNFAVIFCYQVDSQGEYRDDDDMLGVLTIEGHHTPESVTTEGLADRVFEALEEGTHVKFELYNVTFSGATAETNESLMARIKDEMENMIDKGELSYVNDYDFYATVAS